MSRATVDKEAVLSLLRSLKMPGAARVFDAFAKRGREERWGFEEYLFEVLSSEQSSRNDSAVRNRLRDARFPDLKTIEEFDFLAVGGVSPQTIADLARGDFIAQSHNVIFAGPIGTGKTHLAIALGVEAARRKRRVLFVRVADLVRSLVEARDNKELSRLHRKLQSVELLICDEFGFVPFDRQGGELLFNLLSARHAKRSTILTTNLPFAEWIKVLGGDERLTTALLDRLGENATIIATKGKSYRMRRRAAVDAPPVVLSE